ncbi:uncharacterized protein SAPINGB_P003582 [Magnusiomyces paraingens]|uniref:cAMP-dependent protein kinase regulatory subunit n=1 Tax=Magnusiomyces paraingens TaxID=2606893 RepID=A0A5E8BXJ1_9ASCO|nr:uncharacterized protein SAPINGB_P003582 [Saprochaete ingens]VVT53455.1 unnamed protein product [Saprochaete ingens]
MALEKHPEDPTHVDASPSSTTTAPPLANAQSLHTSSDENKAAPSSSPFSGFKSSFGGLDSGSGSGSAARSSRPPHSGGGSSLFSGSYGGAGSPGIDAARQYNANRRTSVSAESLNPANFSGASIEAPTCNLTPEQLERLNKSVAKNFLFNNLDEDSLHRVLGALHEKRVKKGEVIIKQGDEGDYFYVVEKGSVQYIVNDEVVGKAGPGASFGELALMYNAPRAATVTALEDSVLWALDRVTFRRILLDKTASKRKMYGEFLKDVPILSTLDTYQLSKLADALSSETYETGQVVIKEGDVGDKFYIVENGNASVTKNGEGKVQDLTKGSYFGEVALLNDLPRQATVTAETKLRVVCLDKAGFQRLLGSVVDVLKAHDPTQH